ncbi:MAG: single-stranded DNA-binding protein [Endomicrobium sp.]|jgi:single-strand DNA-binding protein|nr:single-stranded DNA-binding protein [Endomicrobium sp.]
MKNQVSLIGRLGKDPELVTFENGGKIVNLSIAVDDSYKKDGEKIKQSYWINLVGNGNVADVITKYFVKGDQIAVTGKLKVRDYEKDGEKRFVTEVVIQSVVFEASITAHKAATEESSNEEVKE